VSAVLTDVEKCVELRVLVTYQDNALIGYAFDTIVTRVRYLAGMTDVAPAFVEDIMQFLSMNLRIVVIA